jgi:hypothetical protein
MRHLVILFVHVIATLARLWGPGGIRSVVAESVFVKQQLWILNRSRQRSPIYSLPIASLPVCVLSSFAPPA